jgi:hypothetical protein
LNSTARCSPAAMMVFQSMFSPQSWCLPQDKRQEHRIVRRSLCAHCL